jgi:cobalt ECF transporter T component CbiQ
MSTTKSTPSWLLDTQIGLCPCGCIGTRKKVNLIDQTIEGVSGFVRRALGTDELANSDGVLQRLDPRTKVVVTMVGLVVVALLRHVPLLIVVAVTGALLAAATRLPVGRFVRRAWFVTPLFAAMVSVPAVFNVVTHGHVVVPLGHPFGHRFGITAQGLRTAALLTTRVAASATVVLLLVQTTSWPRVLAALRSLRVPTLFVQILGMAHRYIFQLVTAVEDMFLARRSRQVNHAIDARSGRMLVGATAGALFGKAQSMADEVTLAMTARGDRGTPRALSSGPLPRRDIAVIIGAIVLMASMLWLDRALGR